MDEKYLEPEDYFEAAQQIEKKADEILGDVESRIEQLDASEEVKEELRKELARVKEETVKLSVEGVQPRRHFSTNQVPIGVNFKLAKSGAMYTKMKDGSLRRINADGSLAPRNRRARGNAAKSTKSPHCRQSSEPVEQ